METRTLNPLKEMRLHSKMTQKFLADITNMTPHAILRYEQGLYEDLSPKLSLFLSEQLDVLPSEIEKQYHDFQRERRQASAQYLSPFPALVMNAHEHPFIYFRNVVTMRAVGKKTRVGFCILLAMNPAVVIQYENGTKLNLTSVMRDALKDAGVSFQHLEDLDSYGEIWMERYGC